MNIETLAKFVDDPDKEQSLQKEEWVKFCFRLDQVASFNDSKEGYTTIELTTGFRQTIAIDYNEFLKLYPEGTIKQMIHPKANYEYTE